MRALKRSLVRVAAASLWVACLGFMGPGCAGTADSVRRGGGVSPAATGLRSQRRLVYLVDPSVPVTARPDAGVAPGLDRKLHHWVKHDMGELGLEIDGDPGGYDLAVKLSASVQGVGQLVRARATAWVLADGQLLEQIDSAEIIDSPQRLAGALARDIVERLARSPRAAEYADTLYGRRLRPLHDSVGRHAVGRADQGGNPPFLDAPVLSNDRQLYNRTLKGSAEVTPPPVPSEAARATAGGQMQAAGSLLQAGQLHDAYVAFEGAYILAGDAEALFGMAETLLKSGDRQDALIFYRAYLGRAAPGSPSAARAVAQIGAIDTPAPPPHR